MAELSANSTGGREDTQTVLHAWFSTHPVISSVRDLAFVEFVTHEIAHSNMYVDVVEIEAIRRLLDRIDATIVFLASEQRTPEATLKSRILQLTVGDNATLRPDRRLVYVLNQNNAHYNWIIVTDADGQVVLTPTKGDMIRRLTRSSNSTTPRRPATATPPMTPSPRPSRTTAPKTKANTEGDEKHARLAQSTLNAESAWGLASEFARADVVAKAKANTRNDEILARFAQNAESARAPNTRNDEILAKFAQESLNARRRKSRHQSAIDNARAANAVSKR
jgi:hypothetical protein